MPPSQIKAGIPPELDHIILKALEKDRETRYQGAAELRADLKRLKRSAESGAGRRPSQAVARVRRAAAPKAAPRSAGTAAGWRKPVFIGAPLLTARARRRILLLSIDHHAGADAERHRRAVVGRESHRRHDVRRHARRSARAAASAVAVPERRARAAGAGDAAPDGPRADDADHRRGRARSLPARRRQGAARRHHRHARLVVRADAQRAGLRRRQGARRRAGAGAVEGNRAGRDGHGGVGVPREARRVARVDPALRREDRGGDDAVARSVEGLQPGTAHPPHHRRF